MAAAEGTVRRLFVVTFNGCGLLRPGGNAEPVYEIR